MNRQATIIQWVSIAFFVISFLVVLASLPLDDLLTALKILIQQLGFWAPLVFVVIYALAATLFVPGSALSLAAGVLFGVWLGTAAVWLGASIAIALSFAIARYAVRSRIEEVARTRPRFAAVDNAIGDQGWKIVALMRLSPVFPFSLQNYLFGVTSIRFLPYLIASTTCILPGTFLYVYLGYVGGEAAAAVGGSGSSNTLQLVLRLTGLLATLLVTVYIARIAAKAIAKHAPESMTKQAPPSPDKDEPKPKRSPFLMLAVSILCLLLSLTLFSCRGALRSLFLPPEVKLIELYGDDAGTSSFDHSNYDELLKNHVNQEGLVNYTSIARDPVALESYIKALAQAPFDSLSRDDKLGFLINAYNAFTMKLILEHYPLKSIQSIPSSKRWDDVRWNLPGGTYSLNQIENVLIRSRFREPRVHFALVCAAMGCPKLLPAAYEGKRIEEQLQAQAMDTHADLRRFRYDEAKSEVWLTQVYNWYAQDFVQVHGSILEAAAKYSVGLQQALVQKRSLRIQWLPYDWSLNE